MAAQLHHEPIASGAPTAWMIVLHGILGAGGNWRGIARKVVERRPDWGLVLVDLRHHGRSAPGAPPNTLAACAEDVHALAGVLGATLGPVHAIAGHSFGGKVALATRAFGGLRQTWMFDSSPGARPDRAGDPADTVTQLLGLLEQLPRGWAKRDEFVDAVVAAGQPRPLAQWLAMNLVPAGAGYALRLDLVAIREMIADYLAQDLWASALDPGLGALELVVATRSEVVNTADRARVAPPPPHVRIELVDAGHWLRIDAPGRIVELVATRLPQVG